MNATIPLATAPYAAVLGLLGAALTVNVIVNRVRSGIDARWRMRRHDPPTFWG